jgi:cell division protein FtsN
MNFSRHPCRKNSTARTRPKFREDGMATLIFIALLAIMMILVTAELRSLAHLKREVQFLERQQIKRLNHPAEPVSHAAPPQGNAISP